MKKIIVTIALLISTIMLSGCQEETYTLTLMNADGTLHLEIEYETTTSPLLLPESEDETMMYGGWTDGENQYIGLFDLPKEDLTLTMILEDPSEVFTTVTNSDNVTLLIKGYTGQIENLTIPEEIDSAPVTGIFDSAFENSDLVEVYIPNTVSFVGYSAFKGSDKLVKVEFYGIPSGFYDRMMSGETYRDIMDEYEDDCIAKYEGSNGAKRFEEGCPITEIYSVDSYEILGKTNYIYNVQIDLSLYLESYAQEIETSAFEDATSLESIVLPISLYRFRQEMFINTPNLKEISFHEDNDNFKVVDGVVYSEDLTELIYYPEGLEASTYEIPEGTRTIDEYAFLKNSNIKTIIIPESMHNIFAISFQNLPNLEDFIVKEGNEHFAAFDGVLHFYHSNYPELTTLIKYPNGKGISTYNLDNRVITIGPNAFAYNTSITTINLNDGLEKIDYNAFIYAKNITVLNVPSSVTFVSPSFVYDSSITDVIFNRSMITDGGITLTDFYLMNDSQFNLYVPDDSYNNYYSTTWGNMSEYLFYKSEYTE